MKKIVFFLLILCCFNTAFSKIPVSTENLLDISNRNKPSSGIYTGTPFVKIEPTVGMPKPEKMSGWMDEEKKRLFGTTQITDDKFFQNRNANSQPQKFAAPIQNTPEINYQPPFGEAGAVLYVPHTSDFISIIRLIDETTISVEEFIYTVNPQNSLFTRNLSFERLENNKNDYFQLLKARIDGQNFTPVISVADDEIEIKNTEYLPAGYHSFYLKYLIKNAVLFDKQKGYLDFDVTGYKWPLPINRLTVYVSFPNKVIPVSNGLYFGRNEAIIKNAYNEQTDSAGNTIYRINNPIPALASVKINHIFQNESTSDFSWEKLLNQNPSSFLIIFVLISIVVYLFLSGIYLFFTKGNKKTVQFIQSLHPLELNCLYNGRILPQFVSFYQLNPIPCRQKFLFRYAQSKWGRTLLNVIIYIKISAKYWLTGLVIICGGVYLSFKKDITPSWVIIVILCCMMFVIVSLFYYIIGQHEHQRYIQHYKKTMLNQNIFYGLTEQAVFNLFMRHYLYMAAIDLDAKWLDLAQQNNRNITKQLIAETQQKGEY